MDAIPKSADTLSYVVEGREDSIYTTGATALDATFTLNSQNPLLPNAAIDPDFPVPLIEPYHLCKYPNQSILNTSGTVYQRYVYL